ncbi:dorsal-related immunity factor Dif isoform X2 [Leptinotarsa decemlineata]|uniref:dorsal-related immunity factor Dif isoform X2 n=1 Tax=Leptinotarsa decemlineata TaxID=7539 RepID=UPI003D304A10
MLRIGVSKTADNVGNSNEVDDPFKLSDVIDVIETDTVLTDLDNPIFNGDLSEPVPSTTFGEGQGLVLQPRPAIPTVPNNLGAVPKGGKGVKQLQDDFGSGNGEGILIPELMMTTPVTHQPKRQQPRIRILEQPAPKILRFRYLCESRSAGSFPGINSSPDNPTYPTIQIVGYKGRAIVQVSCVTKDPPYRAHPFNLVSKANNTDYKNGICKVKVDTNENYGVIQFKNMGVQCVKRRGMSASLEMRQAMRVDPFKTGFAHKNDSSAVDLVSVRLCFQAFLEGDTPGRFDVPLKPVISDPIYDKKRACDLKIVKLSDCVSSVAGGRKEIILLCEKVVKEDIQVWFHEKNSDWEAQADVQPSQVHKSFAISFKTPKYRTVNITEPVKVLIQLRRPSDGSTSESLPFQFWPDQFLEPEPLKRKNNKIAKMEELRILQQNASGGMFPKSFFDTNGMKPEQIQIGPPSIPKQFSGSPDEERSSTYTPNIILDLDPSTSCSNRVLTPNIITSQSEMWYQPISPPSAQPSTSSNQQWNIPKTEILITQRTADFKSSSRRKEENALDRRNMRRLNTLPNINLIFPNMNIISNQFNESQFESNRK